MQKKFYSAPKKHGKLIKSLLLAIFIAIIPAKSFAGDVPIDRNFMKLPDGRWVWLRKIGWHSTQVILGKGQKSPKNGIWSKVYETDGQRHSWAYAFFIKIKSGKFIIHEKPHDTKFAISTYDMGTGMLRWAIVYRVRNDQLEIAEEIDNFNVAADENLFK
jgi:hypothetical protein